MKPLAKITLKDYAFAHGWAVRIAREGRDKVLSHAQLRSILSLTYSPVATKWLSRTYSHIHDDVTRGAI